MHVDVIELVQGCKNVDETENHLPKFLCCDHGHNRNRVENHRVKFSRPAQKSMLTTICGVETLIQSSLWTRNLLHFLYWPLPWFSPLTLFKIWRSKSTYLRFINNSSYWKDHQRRWNDIFEFAVEEPCECHGNGEVMRVESKLFLGEKFQYPLGIEPSYTRGLPVINHIKYCSYPGHRPQTIVTNGRTIYVIIVMSPKSISLALNSWAVYYGAGHFNSSHFPPRRIQIGVF